MMDVRFPACLSQHLDLKRHGTQQIGDALRAFIDIKALHQLWILRRDADRTTSGMAVMAMMRLGAQLVIVLDVERPIAVEPNQGRGTTIDCVRAQRDGARGCAGRHRWAGRAAAQSCRKPCCPATSRPCPVSPPGRWSVRWHPPCACDEC